MTINNPNTLLHTDFQNDTHITISAPAVNSSGDVYHIAAYIILCQHYKWPIPHIYIGYDRSTTEIQAQRTQLFLGIIGFEPYTHCILTPTESNYATPRSSSMRRELLDKTVRHMDQKITTSLLHKAIDHFGYLTISRILKAGFIDTVKHKMPAHHHEKCHRWLKKQLHKVQQWRSNSKKQHFIILHHRLSNNANDIQNLNNRIYRELAKSFKKRSYDVFTVYVCGNNLLMPAQSATDHTRITYHEYARQQSNAISVFDDDFDLPEQYDKWRHYYLIYKMSRIQGFSGVIGGTSGTLDVIAMLGIRVFNLHTFSDHEKKHKDKNKRLLKQNDYRICLQSNFMTVCRNAINDRYHSGSLKKMRKYLQYWLDDKAMTSGLNLLIRHINPENIHKLLDDEHDGKGNERAVFQYLYLDDKNADQAEKLKRKDHPSVAVVSPDYKHHLDQIETQILEKISLFSIKDVADLHPTTPHRELFSAGYKTDNTQLTASHAALAPVDTTPATHTNGASHSHLSSPDKLQDGMPLLQLDLYPQEIPQHINVSEVDSLAPSCPMA